MQRHVCSHKPTETMFRQSYLASITVEHVVLDRAKTTIDRISSSAEALYVIVLVGERFMTIKCAHLQRPQPARVKDRKFASARAVL